MARIIHFGKYYFPDTGGIESVTASLARGAASAGHSVSVVCFKKTPAKTKEVIDGVQVTRAPLAMTVASQPLGFKYFFLCLKAAKQADIVHLHTPNMLAALCALFIGGKTQLLVHWHSDIVDKGLLGIMLRPLEFCLLKRAGCIAATSQDYANASGTLAPHRHKMTVVPIGVPHTQREGSDSQLPQQVKEKVFGKKIILAVGRLVPYKGFEVLVLSAKDLSDDSIVVIVGQGSLMHDLQKLADSTGVSDRVVITGHLSETAVQTLLTQAALYCLPSVCRAEAFGVVLLEAMAYGLPIVATNIPGSGVPWVNQQGVSGLNVPVGDPEVLAEACNQILNSTQLHNKLSSGARQRFLSTFTEELFIKRMMDLYDRLMSSRLHQD